MVFVKRNPFPDCVSYVAFKPDEALSKGVGCLDRMAFMDNPIA